MKSAHGAFIQPVQGTPGLPQWRRVYGAVRQAIIAAREVGRQLLGALGDYPESTTTPYI